MRGIGADICPLARYARGDGNPLIFCGGVPGQKMWRENEGQERIQSIDFVGSVDGEPISKAFDVDVLSVASNCVSIGTEIDRQVFLTVLSGAFYGRMATWRAFGIDDDGDDWADFEAGGLPQSDSFGTRTIQA